MRAALLPKAMLLEDYSHYLSERGEGSAEQYNHLSNTNSSVMDLYSRYPERTSCIGKSCTTYPSVYVDLTLTVTPIPASHPEHVLHDQFPMVRRLFELRWNFIRKPLHSM